MRPPRPRLTRGRESRGCRSGAVQTIAFYLSALPCLRHGRSAPSLPFLFGRDWPLRGGCCQRRPASFSLSARPGIRREMGRLDISAPLPRRLRGRRGARVFGGDAHARLCLCLCLCAYRHPILVRAVIVRIIVRIIIIMGVCALSLLRCLHVGLALFII